MSDIEACLNIIEALRVGTCWCAKSDSTSGFWTHTAYCHSAIALLTKYGRYVPNETML